MRNALHMMGLVVMVLALGCGATKPAPMEPQEWLRSPTPRPSLMDVEKRVIGLITSPEKFRGPVLPTNWPPTSDDLHVFVFHAEAANSEGVWNVFEPTHRVDLEVMGTVETIKGLGGDVVKPVGTQSASPGDTLEVMAEAEEALIHVLAGRMSPDEARPALGLYLDWVDAVPHRAAMVQGDASGFFLWLKSTAPAVQ